MGLQWQMLNSPKAKVEPQFSKKFQSFKCKVLKMKIVENKALSINQYIYIQTKHFLPSSHTVHQFVKGRT